MRPVVIAANWKMHTTPPTPASSPRLIAARTRVDGPVERVICPPFVCLAAVGDGARRDAASRSAPRTSTTS